MLPLQPAILVLFMSLVLPMDGEQIITWTCGERLVDHRTFITNSYPTNHWPWHAAIFHRDDDSTMEYKCGGTVITSDSILTAGHCVSHYNEPLETRQVWVSLGRLNLGLNESSAQSLQVIFMFFV